MPVEAIPAVPNLLLLVERLRGPCDTPSHSTPNSYLPKGQSLCECVTSIRQGAFADILARMGGLLIGVSVTNETAVRKRGKTVCLISRIRFSLPCKSWPRPFRPFLLLSSHGRRVNMQRQPEELLRLNREQFEREWQPDLRIANIQSVANLDFSPASQPRRF